MSLRLMTAIRPYFAHNETSVESLCLKLEKNQVGGDSIWQQRCEELEA